MSTLSRTHFWDVLTQAPPLKRSPVCCVLWTLGPRRAHAQTDADLETCQDLLAQEQSVTEQLRADKQALHSTYLSRVEEEQTKRQVRGGQKKN
eukprot:SAG22_NODE_188_length_15821_cov_38.313319_15_plen_93_part_00